jgi:hypothetical protein
VVTLRPVDPALLLAVHSWLSEHARGRANAVTWDDLRHHLTAWPYSLEVGVVRRLQEVAAALRRQGCPVVGISGVGVFWAETVEELDEAIGERRRRALSSLGELSTLKRIKAEMLGQARLDGRAA